MYVLSLWLNTILGLHQQHPQQELNRVAEASLLSLRSVEEPQVIKKTRKRG
jgi:hypothetical protein